MLDLTDPLMDRIKTAEGVRPQVAEIPLPGTYWLRTTSCNFYWVDKDGVRLEQPTHNQLWAVYTWDLSETTDWFLAQVDDDGQITVMGNDEVGVWEGRHFLVTHVGPKVEYAPTREPPLLQCVDCKNTESCAGAMARYFNRGRCLHCGGYFKVVRA